MPPTDAYGGAEALDGATRTSRPALPDAPVVQYRGAGPLRRGLLAARDSVAVALRRGADARTPEGERLVEPAACRRPAPRASA